MQRRPLCRNPRCAKLLHPNYANLPPMASAWIHLDSQSNMDRVYLAQSKVRRMRPSPFHKGSGDGKAEASKPAPAAKKPAGRKFAISDVSSLQEMGRVGIRMSPSSNMWRSLRWHGSMCTGGVTHSHAFGRLCKRLPITLSATLKLLELSCILCQPFSATTLQSEEESEVEEVAAPPPRQRTQRAAATKQVTRELLPRNVVSPRPFSLCFCCSLLLRLLVLVAPPARCHQALQVRP